MPPREDLTKDWRKSPNLKAYILVGEEDASGTEETWQPNKDGFERERLGDVKTISPNFDKSKVELFERQSENPKERDETRLRVQNTLDS